MARAPNAPKELENDDLEHTLIDFSCLIVSMLISPEGLRLIRITNAESYRMPEIGEHTYRHGHQFIARYLADLFRRRIPGANSASPADLDDFATAFLNLLSGPARLNAWGLSNDEINVEQFVCRRVSLFLNGINAARRRLYPPTKKRDKVPCSDPKAGLDI